MLPIRPATRARIARPRALRRALRRAPTPTAKRPRVLLAPPGRGTASRLGRLLRAAANKHARAVRGAGARRGAPALVSFSTRIVLFRPRGQALNRGVQAPPGDPKQ